jgi:hypothetical protein
MKHNKKRNTAFLYECLTRELTKSLIAQDKPQEIQVRKILETYFSKGTPLSHELLCYEALLESHGLDLYTAEKLLFQTKKKHELISRQEIFSAQSNMIKEINKSIGSMVYSSFVPNYKSFATIAQIFGTKAPLQQKVLMEKQILEDMTKDKNEIAQMEAPNSLVIKKFVDRFNDKYKGLREGQRTLLSHYITSFSNNGVDFKVYANRELKRLYEEIESSLQLKEVSSDPQMVESTKKVLESLNTINVSSMGSQEILKVLKIQDLVNEYTSA